MSPASDRRRPHVLALAALASAAACGTHPELIDRADRIYHGGTVVTVDADDRIAEAVAIRDGRILAVGSDGDVMVHRDEDTEVVDLAGKAMLPGFIDAHGQFVLAALVASMADLRPPPAGTVTSIADLQRILRQRAQERELAEGAWILGFGYDDALLAERRHPTRADLDAVSTEHPVFVLHASGQIAAVNSKALALAGVTAETPDPEGGRIGRVADGSEPSGVLEGAAAERIFRRLPSIDIETAVDWVAQVQRLYLSAGITTAQQSALGKLELRALIASADDDLLRIDVVGYPRAAVIDEMIPDGVRYGAYYRHFRFGGVSLPLDDDRGQRTTPEGDLQDLVDRFFERGFQVLAQANGEAAATAFVDAVARAAREHGGGDRRAIMVYVHAGDEEQLDRLKGLGIVPSFFPAQVFYANDWYGDALSPERAAQLSPAGAAERRGMRFTLHADAPVTPPDALRLVWLAATRQTRSGEVLGPDQRIDVMQALRAVTIDAAWAYFEEEEKGSIEVGKLADLVVLSRSPLDVDPDELRTLEVVETIKEGETVFRRDEAAAER